MSDSSNVLKCRGSYSGCETFYSSLIQILQMANSDLWTPLSTAKCGIWDMMKRSLLLAQYLFSFLVLFAFFKQPSHAKLQKRVRLNQRRGRENVWQQQKPATHPEGQIVSLCRTQIWCILRPQSIHSTSLRRKRSANVAYRLISSFKRKMHCILISGLINLQFRVQCVILLLFKLILVYWPEVKNREKLRIALDIRVKNMLQFFK